MPRSVLQDHLQNFSFWLADVAPIEALALPIFSPLFGFSAITAPEIQIETEEIRECNWPYARKVVKSASVSSITLERGVLFYDSDFWRWIRTALSGNTEDFGSNQYGLATSIAGGAFSGGIKNEAGIAAAALSSIGGLFGFPRIGGPSYRRTLLLVQTFPRINAAALSPALGILLGGVVSGINAGSALGVGAALGFAGGGSRVERVPARAWTLKNCIPTRYKVASDFDATSSDVSVAELEIEVEMFEEVSLAS